MQVSTHLHLVLRFRMCDAIPALTHATSQYVAYLRPGTTLLSHYKPDIQHFCTEIWPHIFSDNVAHPAVGCAVVAAQSHEGASLHVQIKLPWLFLDLQQVPQLGLQHHTQLTFNTISMHWASALPQHWMQVTAHRLDK